MADGTETSRGGASSQQPLSDVVKGLMGEPPLLFGIGAGIVLVSILAVTTSIVVVAIVAVIFLAALGTWLVRETRARLASGARTRVSSERAEVDDSANVGGIRTPDTSSSLETDVQADDAKVGKGAIVGGIEIGDSRREGG
jgi:hypothetical protein